MLATPWERRRGAYDIVIIGSGYGGAISAARIAAASLDPKPSVCLLERGKEWAPKMFPEQLSEAVAEARSDLNPLGLYELLNYPDISVIKGSGLGGTSLINANVAIRPDAEIFSKFGWPASITYESLQPHYDTAASVLGANPHPRAMELAKVQALDRRARQFGARAQPVDIVVNFKIDGVNPYGVEQKPCNDCGNCVSGCNVGAKNTLYMNYLPAAARAGAIIFTQTKVEWLEKRAGGGWRIHGKHIDDHGPHSFTLDAGQIILSAGSLNTTEILLRSEMHGLSVSPALGTKFNGNADFFGLAYNGDPQTNVLGYAYQTRPGPGDSPMPGPNIVGVVRYTDGLAQEQRIAIEDFSFPRAYVEASKAVFGLIRGEDTVAGNEQQQNQRLQRDLNPAGTLHDPNGAMSHTMLYLVMGHDNARGTILFEAPWTEPDGRIRVSWDRAGQQQIFTRMNQELRRHARALSANFISNPTWSVFNIGHLITAHPLGGCPMGDDHVQGAVDPFGRVFAGDGSVHSGLYVIDGSVLPSAIGVNPFLTISALAERFADRKVRQLAGEAYPAPPKPVSMSGISALDASTWSEAELERLFRRCTTLPIDTLVNSGAPTQIDIASQTIRNDHQWKGYFPHGHVLNAMSSAIFTGFQKAFQRQGNKYTGLTSDTDGRIRARNSLEMIDLPKAEGTLEAGKYILLRYLDPPWQGFYDIFKIVNDDLLIGRVYLGEYPNGMRLFTFPMTRRYAFSDMAVADHAELMANASVPTPADLDGVWRMDVISNANHLGSIAYLQFQNLPDGRFVARYELLGVMEGLVVPAFLRDHFQLNDFTPFHDEIRKVTPDFLVGKYVTQLPGVLAPYLSNSTLGLFHTAEGGEFGFYYTLTRAGSALPANSLLRPFLEAQLPDGVGLTFDERMEGYFGGESVSCSFNARMTIADVNEFIDGYEHEASISGIIDFGAFNGTSPASFRIDETRSRFHYLRINPATGEAEMNYHIEFADPSGARYALDGVKHMQKTSGEQSIRDLLGDYTTLYTTVRALDGSGKVLGTGVLKFRTFEDFAAVSNLAGFLASFQVTGTSDPRIQTQARLRFIAFTGQFVQREYDPLGFPASQLATDVAAEVARGADTPDYFSTRPTADLQKILRDSPTLDLSHLLNNGAVRTVTATQRIFHDSFWKGSFAQDTLLGWEQRIRAAALGETVDSLGKIFAGGSFFKRFDSVANGVAKGYVVNYELKAIPGLPEVTQINYPDNRRAYFKAGDPVLLLKYTNDPYKLVYDTIKLIDENNAIGVMHIGEFPNGFEFATFVMSRNNYPFEFMSLEDHQRIFADPTSSRPAPADLIGTWTGRQVSTPSTAGTLSNQLAPTIEVRFEMQGAELAAHYSTGGVEVSETVDPATLSASFRTAGGALLGIRNALRFVASGRKP